MRMKRFVLSSINSIVSRLLDLLQWSSSQNSEIAETEKGMVLNDDVIEEILLRLPTKSLVRFKSLSKQWHFLISESPSFRRIYFSRMKDTSPHVLGFFCSRYRNRKTMKIPVQFLPACKEGLMLKSGEETWGAPAPPFDHTLSFMSQGNLNVMASSGGFLLCSLQVDYPLDYFICNPITKQWVALPRPTFTRNIVVHGLAICQDETTACYLPLDLVKYKVFRLTWKQAGWAQPTDAAVVEIFSSELRQWNAFHLNSTMDCFGPHLRNKMVMALQEEEGVFGFYSSTLTIHSTIASVVYDPRNDYLDLIEVPGGRLDNGTSDGWGLSQGRVHYARHDWRLLQVWTLDNNPEHGRREWSLKQSVDIQTPLQSYGELLGPLKGKYYVEAFHPTSPHLLFLNYDSKVVLFNTEDSSIQLLSNGWKLTYHFFLYAWPHWPPLFH